MTLNDPHWLCQEVLRCGTCSGSRPTPAPFGAAIASVQAGRDLVAPGSGCGSNAWGQVPPPDDRVGGVDFADEDLLIFHPSGPSWTLLYDGSAEAAALAAADVEAIALPEPGQLLLLSSGLGLLLGLGRRRVRA